MGSFRCRKFNFFMPDYLACGEDVQGHQQFLANVGILFLSFFYKVSNRECKIKKKFPHKIESISSFHLCVNFACSNPMGM